MTAVAVERTRVIGAPIEEVWSALAEFDRLAEWADNADHTCWLDEPRPDGEMVGRARRVQAGNTVLIETITTWEPPERLAYRLDGLPPIVRSASNEWRLARQGDGRTSVALVSHVDCGPRPPQQLIARLVGRRLAAASEVMLAGLADLLDGRAKPDPAVPHG
jgi:uncharacterized protein YndB with AHSA1/START domain